MCCSVLSCISCVQLFAALWTVVHQTPLSMGFFRQEHWSGLPCPPPGDLPNPEIRPESLISPALAGGFLTTSAIWEAQKILLFLSIVFRIQNKIMPQTVWTQLTLQFHFMARTSFWPCCSVYYNILSVHFLHNS